MSNIRFPPQTSKVRENIKVRHLVKLLQDDARGKKDCELSTGRRKSIEILLKKCMPDVAVVAVADTDGNTSPVSIKITI